MGIVNRNDIRGVLSQDSSRQILCAECMKDPGEYKEDEILRNEIDEGDELYYCDECKEKL